MDSMITSRKQRRFSVNNVSKTAWIVRGLFRIVGWFFTTFLTHTIVEGEEHIPKNGPAIYAANHASIYDAALYFVFLPFRTQFVGPGDFRLRMPNRMAAEWTDVILVKRGSSDTRSLRAMIDTLKSGSQLALFPEGGTWEKGLYDVKDGAAYLSMIAQAPIVPIAISGTYNLWNDIWKFKRPTITMRFLPPMQPVRKVPRNERKAVLQEASIDLMYRIYQELEEDELERYKVYMRQRFSGKFITRPQSELFAKASNYQRVAELVSKKNLFSTFHEHLKLPLTPFLQLRRYHSLKAVRAAVRNIRRALDDDVPGYITYRLGQAAEKQIKAELDEMQSTLEAADNPNLRLRFLVEVQEGTEAINIDPPQSKDIGGL